MDKFTKWKDQSETNLLNILDQNLIDHNISEVIHYSTLPAGKLFRSMLAYTLSNDLNTFDRHIALWASSIELHHTYTLIHDDLPAMDNDDMRRGRLSCHKKFNEWKAILAGDALLVLSFGILKDLPAEKLPKILEIYNEHTGPKGLILGQVMDLGAENETLIDLLKIHDLKTAKLIQLTLRGTNILSDSPITDELCMEIGEMIGINFQLLDDLCELCDELGAHELEINPFLHFDSNKLLDMVEANTTKLRDILVAQQLTALKDYLNIYMAKIQEKLRTNITQVQKHIMISSAQISNLKI